MAAVSVRSAIVLHRVGLPLEVYGQRARCAILQPTARGLRPTSAAALAGRSLNTLLGQAQEPRPDHTWQPFSDLRLPREPPVLSHQEPYDLLGTDALTRR